MRQNRCNHGASTGNKKIENLKFKMMNELEEKVAMLEELIQGFLKRMNVVETEMPEFLKTFLQRYKEHWTGSPHA